tara:strand:- start:2004 stop:3509 length:1506 start_codon:yes stop_codon:yes gene_type:complete
MSSKISYSDLTKQKYVIPDILDDKNNIDEFIQLNAEKKIIVVQGLGFVGAVMSIVCANSKNDEYAVIGVDLPSPESYWKICSINDGVFPVVSSDKKVDKYFKNTIKKNNFYATYDEYAYSQADAIIVDINLDVQKKYDHVASDQAINYSVNLDGFKKAIKLIGKNCKEDVLILIETTVPPGSTIIAKEILYKALHERNLSVNKIKIGHSYERVMPGPNYIDSIKNFYRVYSGIDKRSADYIEKFLKTIISIEKYPLTRLKNTNSTEMAKVLENSYRAMNISFIVEWTRFAEEAGVDLFEVVDAIRMRPTHKNIMLPGLGVGGYCLTKDPLLASWSKKNIIGSQDLLEISESAVSNNDNMPYYAYKIFKSFFNKKDFKGLNIFMLGVSYAPDVGDTRYSPVELLSNLLLKNGCKIKFHDPYISHWNELQADVSNNFENLNDSLDALIISTGHSFYKNNKNLIDTIMKIKPILIFDTIGVLTNKEINKLTEKHVVKVIGRGDI